MKRSSLFIVFLLLSSISFAQQTDYRSLAESWRTAYNVPGMSVGIIQDGQIILSEGFGVLENGKSQKADKNTLYSIASNTKAFVASALASLVEEGKLKWDDKVRTWLPYFELYDPCVTEMMTVRDLLTHRSGLGTFSGDVIWYRSDYSAEDVVRHAEHIPQAFEFRDGYGYSNVMYIAAGEVIKAATGKSWDQVVKEKFLSPLGMDRTITSVRQISATSNAATPHKPEGKVENPIDWVNWDNMGAAGGIISSVDDMLKWINMQLQNGVIGTDTFFSKQTQLTMWTPQSSFPVSSAAHDLYGRNFSGYGLGWSMSEYHGHFVVSHTGGYDGMYSSVYMLPHQKIGVVVLTNSMHSIGPLLTFEIFDRLLGLPQKDWKDRGLRQDEAGANNHINRVKERTDAQIKNTKPTLMADQIAGLYRDPMYGDIRIDNTDGQLTIDFVASPQLKASLEHWHYDTYKINWMHEQAWFDFGTVQILKDNNGEPAGLQFDVPNDDIFFEEIKSVRVSK